MKAVQLQRPFGVAIKRLSQDTNTTTNPIHEDNAVSVELFYVEQPAPYRGFDRTSSAMVARHTIAARSGQVLIQFATRGMSEPNDGLPAGWDADLFPPGVIRPDDVIEIDGTQYRLLGGTPSNAVRTSLTMRTASIESTGGVTRIDAQPINDTGQMMNIEFDANGGRIRDFGVNPSPAPVAPYWTNPAPYKILRQPMPTSAEPFQLPEGTAIDLRASGIGNDDYFYVPNKHDNSEGVLIMFAPEGRVSRVLFSRNNTLLNQPRFDEAVTDNLYLLIGRRENAPPPAVANDPTLESEPIVSGKNEQQLQELKETVNWLRSESRWIAIGPQSGRVVTIENAFVDPKAIINKYTAAPTIVEESSEELRNEQIKASREFAREMTQVGGR